MKMGTVNAVMAVTESEWGEEIMLIVFSGLTEHSTGKKKGQIFLNTFATEQALDRLCLSISLLAAFCLQLAELQ